MRTYILRRLLYAIPALIVISMVIFLVLRVLPGDILSVMFGAEEAMVKIDEQKRAALMADLGLDRPLYVQYVMWLKDIVTGDLGTSWWLGEPISKLIIRRLPLSAEVGILSFILSWIIGIPIGILSALRQDTVGDYVARTTVVTLLAMPNFWIAALIIVAMVTWFQWFPPTLYIPLWENPKENLMMVVTPAVILSLHQAAMIARMSRSTLLEVFREDYIRTARAKGLGERMIMWRHGLKNAMIPVLTLSSVTLGFTLGGSVAVEYAFNLPGLGLSMVEAVTDRDFVVIQNLVLLYASLFVAINLVVDVMYGWLDPRIRYN